MRLYDCSPPDTVTILDQIIERTRETLVVRKRRTRVGSLGGDAHRVAHDVAAALRADPRGSDIRFVAECKRRSPSKGLLREAYDPVAIAEGYARAGASLVSVLTEPDFFDGSPDHLRAVREELPELPLLRKDFVVDAYQIHEAKAWGADCVLLIAAALDRSAMHDLQATAAGLGLHALIEVHSPFELDHVDVDAARIVGVNHRDLRTFEVDLGRSAEVWRILPEEIVRVAESGLKDDAVVAELARAGTDAVLIGEAFVVQPDPGAALAEMRDRVMNRIG